MNALEAIAKRRSTRAYKPDQIPEESLQEIVKAGFRAPVASAKYDSLHITVVQNRELLHEIGASVSQLLSKMMRQKMDKDFGAPTMVFVSAQESTMPTVDYANAGCVLENMVVAATALGIDSVLWAGGCLALQQDDALRQAVGIPEGHAPLLCASFGYAAVRSAPKAHAIAVNRV